MTGSHAIRTICSSTVHKLTAPVRSFAAKYAYLKDGNVQTAEFHQASSTSADKRYLYTYSYDALHRMTNAAYGFWTGSSYLSGNKYLEGSITYDGNGNLTKLRRYNQNAKLMDDLNSNYVAGTNRRGSIMRKREVFSMERFLGQN